MSEEKFKKTIQSVFDGIDTEDGGCAKIVTIVDEADDSEDGLYIRVISWSKSKEHPEFDKLIGKKVKITIEEID